MDRENILVERLGRPCRLGVPLEPGQLQMMLRQIPTTACVASPWRGTGSLWLAGARPVQGRVQDVRKMWKQVLRP